MDAYRDLSHELQAIRARTSGTAEIRVLAITTLGEDYRFSDSIGGAARHPLPGAGPLSRIVGKAGVGTPNVGGPIHLS